MQHRVSVQVKQEKNNSYHSKNQYVVVSYLKTAHCTVLQVCLLCLWVCQQRSLKLPGPPDQLLQQAEEQ